MIRKTIHRRHLLRECLMVCAGLLLVGMSGCYSPNLGPPGSIGAQRSRFTLNDPYPRDDLGPPIVGGRPLGFDVPLSGPTNIQYSQYAELNKSNPGFFQRLQLNRQRGYNY